MYKFNQQQQHIAPPAEKYEFEFEYEYLRRSTDLLLSEY